MADLMVQSIHRDPALLYVILETSFICWINDFVQLLDSLPYLCCHGAPLILTKPCYHVANNIQILTGVLRHYATVLLQTTPKKQELHVQREQRSLLRGINLRSNSSAISSTAFASRRQYLVTAYKDGTFLKDPENRGKPAGNPMTDPAAMEGMMGMMKGNMAMMIPQTLIMGWINAFFAGFVISTSNAALDSWPSSVTSADMVFTNQ